MTKGLTGLWADRKVGGCGNCPEPPEFLVESDAVTGDCFGRSSLRWQRIGDGHHRCTLCTVVSVPRFCERNNYELAGSYLEYSSDPANQSAHRGSFAKVCGFSRGCRSVPTWFSRICWDATGKVHESGLTAWGWPITTPSFDRHTTLGNHDGRCGRRPLPASCRLLVEAGDQVVGNLLPVHRIQGRL
jgi:hypothetical protein